MERFKGPVRNTDNLGSFENDRGQMSRRGFLTGLGAAAATGYLTAKAEPLIFTHPERLDLQKILNEVRGELPEGAPINLSITEDGEIIYSHKESPVTTEFVNYLAGRGEITEELVAASLRKDMFNFMRGLGEDITTRENRDKLYGINTETELVAFYVENFDFFSEELKQKWRDDKEGLARYRVATARKTQEEYLKQIKPEFYDKLWKTYIMAGAAPIEMVDRYERRSKHKNHLAGSAHAFVADEKNSKIKIDLTGGYKSLLAGFLAEVAHLYSFTHDREGFIRRRAYQEKVIGSFEGLSDEEILERRNIAYVTPGTLENHDHTFVFESLGAPLISSNPVIKEIIQDEKDTLEEIKNSIEAHTNA